MVIFTTKIFTLGKVSFSKEDLRKNLDAIVSAVIKAKPASAKGTYLKSLTVSSTMGPGVKIDTMEALNIAN